MNRVDLAPIPFRLADEEAPPALMWVVEASALSDIGRVRSLPYETLKAAEYNASLLVRANYSNVRIVGVPR